MSPSQSKFLLDENVDIRVKSHLEKRGFRVLICPKGIKNGEVAALAQKKSCILLTNDKDFANPDLFKPSEFSAIIVFHIHPPKLENLASALDKLFQNIPPAELAGKLMILGEDGVEIIK